MVTPETILELKRQSNASLSACKSALQLSNGDLVKALALLRASTESEVLKIKQITGLSADECADLLNQWGSAAKAIAHLEAKRQMEQDQSTTPKTKPMNQVKPFADIWEINDAFEFVRTLSQYLEDKKVFRKITLNNIESTFYLLATMQGAIEAEGFADLFYQEYSLNECKLVEKGLVEIGLHGLAGLFVEAFEIYTRHNPQITPEMYETLDPFDLPEKEGQRFDQIADDIYADDSELFMIYSKLANYARERRSHFNA